MDTTYWALFSIFLCFPIWLLILGIKKNPSDKGRLPPSPPTIPILGTLLWLRRSLIEISPTLRRLRTQLGPVVTFNVGIFPCIFVIDRHLAHEALVQKGAAFSDRPPVGIATAIYSSNGHTINTGRGPVWRLLRGKLMSEIVHSSPLRSFAGFRRRVLDQLLEDLRVQAASPEGVVVLSRSFRHSLFLLFSLVCFGEKLDQKVIDEVERAQSDLLSITWKLNICNILPLVRFLLWKRWQEFLRIRRRQEEIMIPLINARRSISTTGKEKQQQQQRSDLSIPCYVDALIDLDLRDGGRRLNDREIVSLCSEMFLAGVDTTSSAIEWAMANLVKHPHVQQRLFEEITRVVLPERDVEEDDLQKMPYLKAVILETLRRHPPAEFVLPHAVAEDARLGDYTIPKGSVVNFAVAEIGWDGAIWEEPFEFRPERFLEGGDGEGVDITGSREIKMMPFGAGRRMCPGLGMAMLHLEYYLACLVREFEWKGVDGEEVDLSEEAEFTMVMKNSLRARIISRRSSSAQLAPWIKFKCT